MQRVHKIFTILFGIVAASFFVVPVFASSTDGTISNVNKYAWSSKAGWINFGATHGNVHVTDSGLTGYAWSSLYGWINLSPTNSGVKNTSEGVLSGYAWNENLGWINFTGVSISNSVFKGQASGDNFGVINFDCANCRVDTDWQTLSARTPVPSSPLPPAASSPPAATFSINLNSGAPTTNSTTITVSLNDGSDSSYALVSEDSQLVNNVVRVFFVPGSTSTSTIYILSSGDGLKTIYAKSCTRWGQCGNLVSDSILLSSVQLPPPPQPPSPPPTGEEVSAPPSLPPGGLLGAIGELKDKLSALLAKLLNPKSPAFKLPSIPLAKLFSGIKFYLPRIFNLGAIKQAPIEQLVAKEAPPALSGRWAYPDPRPANRFVFAPLPKEFIALQNKFPETRNTFQRVGINRMTDVSKIKSVSIYLPGLSSAMGIAPPEIKPGVFGVSSSIPVEKLPAFVKDKIPSNVIFAQAAGQLVDFKIALSLTSKGNPEQKIATISGKPLHLTVRPDKAVKRVRGYVIFRSKQVQARVEMPFSDLVASLMFAQPAFAYAQDQPVPVEEKLVLQEFEYTDPDGDGVYTADIQSPIPVGEYEIITVMDYEDPDLGAKQIRLITVVDPEGYVYEKIGDKELRIPGAVVTLYHFDPGAAKYQIWPAKDFQQENPQLTDVRGTYSFLVPGGTYFITIQAPGYLEYQGKPFAVEEGTNGVHTNIEMRVTYWWLKLIDWKTGLLIAIALLLLFNFYQDKKRARSKN